MSTIPDYMCPFVVEESPVGPQVVAQHAVLALNDPRHIRSGPGRLFS